MFTPRHVSILFKNLKEFEDEEGKNVALRMEHFYFPLGMWTVGMLISLLLFIAEVIKHRLGKTKTEVPVAQSQSDIEDSKETP